MNTYFRLIMRIIPTFECIECVRLAKTPSEAMDSLYHEMCEMYSEVLEAKIDVTDRIGFDDPLAPLVLKSWGVEPQYEPYTWDVPIPE